MVLFIFLCPRRPSPCPLLVQGYTTQSKASPLGPQGPFALTLGHFSAQCLSLARAAQALANALSEHGLFPEDLPERPLRGASIVSGEGRSLERDKIRRDRSLLGREYANY